MFTIHTLSNGITVAVTNLHGGKFSDGTKCSGSPMEDVEKLTCHAQEFPVNGKENIVVSKFILTPEIKNTLDELVRKADIVWVSRPFIQALQDAGIRERYPNVLGMNSTLETQRTSNPADKIIDIDRWAW